MRNPIRSELLLNIFRNDLGTHKPIANPLAIEILSATDI
jgi:hypothetical protein